MKIYSPFIDYYDFLQGLGSDEKVIYYRVPDVYNSNNAKPDFTTLGKWELYYKKCGRKNPIDHFVFAICEIYTQQRANLFNILTACIGTEYKIERHFGRDRSVGYTTIKSVQGNDHIIGYRDKSCEHVEIALCFLRAKSYRWFRSKYPV